MCKWRKATSNSDRVLEDLPEENQLEDDVFFDSDSSTLTVSSTSEVVTDDTGDGALAKARNEINVEEIFSGWKKKTWLEKLDAVTLDFWAAGNVSLRVSFCVVASLAVATRLHYIAEPFGVVWDEAHFGKMLSWYINGTYFFDVHPPGGKLILALFGYLGGYNGSHSFAVPGVSYEGYHGILPIRVGCAMLGASLAPLAFASAWTMTRRLPSAVLAGILVVADVGVLALSKFILLDSPLMFFMMVTFLCLCRLHSVTKSSGSFSRGWWTSLAATGVGLGCVISVKFVGLFMVAVVGLYTVHELWELLGTQGWGSLCSHIMARMLCLAVLPAVVYISFFCAHDVLLYKAFSTLGGEEAFLSPEYQMVLQGNLLHKDSYNYSADIMFGNLLTLRNNRLSGPYLHSHNLTYPEKLVHGNLQQVTGYRAKDSNNLFRLMFSTDDPDMEGQAYSGEPEPLVSGDFVRLQHPTTGTVLAAAENPAIYVKKHRLVFAHPYVLQPMDESDDNPLLQYRRSVNTSHVWKVVVEGAADGTPVYTLHTRFALVNVKYGCALTWSLQKLHNIWAQGQEEITCSRNMKTAESVWRIEFNHSPYFSKEIVANTSIPINPLGFWGRFIETHQLMQWTNAHLKPDGSETNSEFFQRPWMWPLCYKSQPWYDVGFRIVLLGNPLVMWLHLTLLMTVGCFLLHRAYSKRRDRYRREDKDDADLAFWCHWLLIAYMFHYLPFYTMDRVLYYHHYFPALQFSALLTAIYLGHHIQNLPHRLSFVVTMCFAAVIMFTFCLFCYIGYGHVTEEPYHPENSTYRHVRLLDTWYI